MAVGFSLESSKFNKDRVAVAAIPQAFLPRSVAAMVMNGVNHVLDQHDWARRELAGFAGSSIAISVVTPLATIEEHAIIQTDGSLLAQSASDQASVAMRVPLNAQTAQAFFKDGSAGLMRQVHIEGNVELAKTLGTLTQHVRWDAQDDLSKVIGDIAAHRVGEGLKSVIAQIRATHHRVVDNGVRFLTEEDQQLVRTDQFAEFSKALRRVRDDVDRLDKRINLLNRRSLSQ
jgi:ubiquinone biosynthesis accessory factor UbiJ